MMPGKRALVVDDSRSARVVLGACWSATDRRRPAESAEAASRPEDGRPDVIFMDHLMLGMDGLQAVRDQGEPELAAIPIMM